MKLPSIFLFFSCLLPPVFSLAQTNPNPLTTGNRGDSVLADQGPGAIEPSGSGPAQDASSTELNQVVVTGNLDQARDQIVPYLGATKYTIAIPKIMSALRNPAVAGTMNALIAFSILTINP